MSNLWECERFLVNVTGVHLDWHVLEAVHLGLFSNLNSSVEVLLVQGNAELVKLVVHLLRQFLLLLPLLCLLSLSFLLLGKLERLGLLSLVLGGFGFLKLLLVGLSLGFLLGIGLLLGSLVFGGLLLLGSFLLSSLLLSFLSGFCLGLSLSLCLLGFDQFP